MSAKNHFLYLVRPPRITFIEDSSPDEDEIVENHFEYLKELLEKKKLVIAGPCADGSFGIVVFKADSDEEAQQIMENDPAVRARLFSAELHPFHLSLLSKE